MYGGTNVDLEPIDSRVTDLESGCKKADFRPILHLELKLSPVHPIKD